MDKTTADPLVGKTVAQYEVVAKLGGGGMGIVYAARDTKLGRLVALKFLPPQWSHDEGAKQRFIREAQAASATDHRNICTIHDIDAAGDGQLFIVMAHYDGQTLKQRIESGPLSIDEALDIAAQVAEGLAKAHAQGVVHRDIKPGNLMLTEDGVKILDFGLAKFADVRFKLTQEGSTLGTVAYMSPEQARGDEADHRSDIWAAGVVLYEMLVGQVPFKGGYPEAISHAIKNDTPPPLRAADPHISEALEQLVFRALHKNPSVRFQSARDLARALRLLQGRTLPLDLRTEPLPAAVVDANIGRALTAGRVPWWRRRAAIAAGAAIVLLLVGVPLWVFAPVQRMSVAVAPVVNQTGYAELDPFRLALTQELVAQLSGSATVRVVPYDRLLPVLRRFQLEGRDMSSPEALQAIATLTGARVMIVPTLLNENNAWKARVAFRNVQTSLSESPYDTPPVVSSLIKDTAYGLLSPLAAGIEEHFQSTGSRRAYLAGVLRGMTGGAVFTPGPRMRTLDAAAAFEQGLNTYDQEEYAAAREAFGAASQQDPRNARLLAWRSRVATLMRLDEEAADLGRQATALLTGGATPHDRLFVEAVAAEARRDFAVADMRYAALATLKDDETSGLMERGAYQDRRAMTGEAIATYLDVLARDGGVMRAQLELCRLYGPTRQNEPISARTYGQRALDAYQRAGWRGGEALAKLCLADVLRPARDADSRRQATEHAQAGLSALGDLGLAYNLPRAHYYVGMVAFGQGRMADAAASFEESLTLARSAGNKVLEPFTLMYLGAANAALRNMAAALDYYGESSKLFEALGDNRRAAQAQANSGNLRIRFGDRPEQGLRDMQNALAVVQKVGDRIFEVFCLQGIASYYRQTGNHAEAERQLNRALSLVGEQDLNGRFASLTRDIGRSLIETADYAGARTRLTEASRDPARTDSTSARIYLAQAHLRLGDFSAARADLQRAGDLQREQNAAAVLPLLEAVQGELAYETGALDEARSWFAKASARWTNAFPDAASVAARSYLALLDARAGRDGRGRSAIQESLDHARRVADYPQEARSRIALAQISIAGRRFDEALARLDEIPPEDDSRTLGPELRAQVRYWRGEALLGRGDRVGAVAEFDAARKLLMDLQASLPAEHREGFASRRDIRAIRANSVRNPG